MTIENFKEYVKTGKALDTKDVAANTVVGGVPAKFINVI